MPDSLAAVVPATDRPAALERCLAALRRSSEPPDELVVVAEPPGAGPAEARNRGVAQTSAELLAFVDADVEVHRDALARDPCRLRRRSEADGGLRQLRRRARGVRGRVAVPQPAAPSRPQQLGGTGRDLLGGARRRASRRLSRGGRLRRGALPVAVDRGHRAGHAAGRARRRDPPRSRDPRHAPEALVAGRHGQHGPLAARNSLGPPAARIRAQLGGSQPRLATPRQRAAGAARADGRRSGAGRWRSPARWRGSSRSTPASTPCCGGAAA